MQSDAHLELLILSRRCVKIIAFITEGVSKHSLQETVIKRLQFIRVAFLIRLLDNEALLRNLISQESLIVENSKTSAKK